FIPGYGAQPGNKQHTVNPIAPGQPPEKFTQIIRILDAEPEADEDVERVNVVDQVLKRSQRRESFGYPTEDMDDCVTGKDVIGPSKLAQPGFVHQRADPFAQALSALGQEK